MEKILKIILLLSFVFVFFSCATKIHSAYNPDNLSEDELIPIYMGANTHLVKVDGNRVRGRNLWHSSHMMQISPGVHDLTVYYAYSNGTTSSSSSRVGLKGYFEAGKAYIINTQASAYSVSFNIEEYSPE